MAATDIGARNVPPVPADDLDDLFDYDVGDVFRDVDTNIDIPARQKPLEKADGKENAAGLGIDEEIKVTKKRAPVPKLDENRLLSQAGIPKLRRITKERLKFTGKGHEYSDVARLLNVYQFWLDDLYPRAKFADGLAMIEKLGHNKRMQTMRKEWINQGKPRDTLEHFGSGGEKSVTQQTSSKPRQDQSPAAKPTERPRTPPNGNAIDVDDDLYGATPEPAREDPSTKRKETSKESLFMSDDEEAGDQPPEDDLDALLAEDDMKEATSAAAPAAKAQESPGRDDNFDDEMEAIAGMGGMNDMW